MIRLLLNAVLFLCAISTPSRADWSGLYVGAHAGGAWGEADGDLEGVGGSLAARDSIDLNGAVGGVHVGYAWQSGRAVFGIEGDYSVTGAEGDMTLYSPFWGINQRITNEVDYLATVRGRLGYDCGRHLIYGTAGIAWTEYELSDELTGGGLLGRLSDKDQAAGFVWGGGAASKLSSKLAARVEVLRYEFDDVKIEWSNVLTVDGSAD